jgi:hypothetical protein
MAGRFYRIFVPFQPHSHFTLTVLSVGILVSFAIGWTVVTLVLILLFPDESDTLSPTSLPAWFLHVLSLAGGLLTSIKWVLAYSTFRNRRRLRTTALRTIRLQRLRLSAEGEHQLPHRVVEEILRRTFHTSRSIKKVFRNLSPGIAIQVLKYGEFWPDCLRRSIDFEPVAVYDNDERVVWLIWQHWSDETVDTTFDTQPKTEQQFKWRHWADKRRDVLGLALGAVIVGGALWDRNVLLIAVLAGILLFPILWRVIINRTWFIVPGGVVLREDHIWSRRTRLGMATPDDSPLIADHRTGEALVMLDGRARKILCPATLPLLVAAWQSTARLPTLEEIETLLSAE